MSGCVLEVAWCVVWLGNVVCCGWQGSVVRAVLCGAVWCVRMIEVMGCDVQGGM